MNYDKLNQFKNNFKTEEDFEYFKNSFNSKKEIEEFVKIISESQDTPLANTIEKEVIKDERNEYLWKQFKKHLRDYGYSSIREYAKAIIKASRNDQSEYLNRFMRVIADEFGPKTKTELSYRIDQLLYYENLIDQAVICYDPTTDIEDTINIKYDAICDIEDAHDLLRRNGLQSLEYGLSHYDNIQAFDESETYTRNTKNVVRKKLKK